jgi:hypothetical protein
MIAQINSFVFITIDFVIYNRKKNKNKNNLELPGVQGKLTHDYGKGKGLKVET